MNGTMLTNVGKKEKRRELERLNEERRKGGGTEMTDFPNFSTSPIVELTARIANQTSLFLLIYGVSPTHVVLGPKERSFASPRQFDVIFGLKVIEGAKDGVLVCYAAEDMK